MVQIEKTLYTVAYSLKTRTVEPQQPAFTRQLPVNHKRGMVFSAQFVPMAAYATMEYVMPSLSNNYTGQRNHVFYAVHTEMLSA
jgi:hypothetical protein